MGLRLLRALYGIEFLMALVAALQFWSQVGGQTHLDWMPWWWKFGISMGLAGAVVRLTIRASKLWIAVIFLLLLTGGLVTYYYHLHEPQDQDQQDSTLTARSAL